jgi:hypothetical protein
LSSEIHAATLQSPSLHFPNSVEQSEAERQDFFLSFHHALIITREGIEASKGDACDACH